MKVHAREILKRNVQFILFVKLAMLCVGTVVANLVTLSKIAKPTLIAIDKNGTRLVVDQDDPIFRSEAASFIHKFVDYSYNFDGSNFMRRIGAATALMSEKLWQQKRSEILTLKDKVGKDDVTVSGELEKLTVDEAGVFYALIRVHEKSRLKEVNHQVKVLIKLAQVERTSVNPYGMEVDFYEETLLRN